MGRYKEELTKAMTYLGENKNTIFLGQAVAVPGTGMFDTLSGVDSSKKIELPVFEESQMGISIGLALNGFIPITIFTRWNFLLLATNQLVNHLNIIPKMSNYKPGIIIRTAIGSERPLFPGYQHAGDFTPAFWQLLDTIKIVRITFQEQISSCYSLALENAKRGLSTIIVEYGDYYSEK